MEWDAELPTEGLMFQMGLTRWVNPVYAQFDLAPDEALKLLAAQLPKDGSHRPPDGTWAAVMDRFTNVVVGFVAHGPTPSWRGIAAGFAELAKYHDPADVLMYELEAQGALGDLSQ
jgi:hypothetical protein